MFSLFQESRAIARAHARTRLVLCRHAVHRTWKTYERSSFLKHYLKLIICYKSSGATNIAEVSSGFQQADWSTTLGIVYCYPISFLLWFICLHVYRNLMLTISAQMKTSAQFKFALYITND